MDFLSSALPALFQVKILPPGDGPLYEVTLRWIHFLAGITWIGLLYFFNLVNVPFQKELEAGYKGKVNLALMPRALWWFRWGAVMTVLAGFMYWMIIVAADARNVAVHELRANSLTSVLVFLGIWIGTWVIEMLLVTHGKGALNKGPFLAVFVGALIFGATVIYLKLNAHGWESSRMLSIGVGGGYGFIMLLNVWGIIWRNQKKIIAWTRANVTEGTPVPEQGARLARQAFLASRTNAWLSVPMLFFMASASHYTFLVQ